MGRHPNAIFCLFCNSNVGNCFTDKSSISNKHVFQKLEQLRTVIFFPCLACAIAIKSIKSMASWESENYHDGKAVEIVDNIDNILVTHDLQDYFDESLDLPSFVKVYEQSAIFGYEKNSDDESSYVGKLPDDSTG